jgi:dTDP-4-dehydrorhamnose 3,5-epimerase
MRFIATDIPGAFIVALDTQCDERGFFARILRGLHFQTPYEEPKLVQCVRGQVWDVALDLRPSSPAYGRSVGVTLSPETRQLFFVPPGCAHGFLTLADETDVLYLMGMPFMPDGQRGVRWNDPAFNVSWPAEPTVISPRDASYPDFVPSRLPDLKDAE